MLEGQKHLTEVNADDVELGDDSPQIIHDRKWRDPAFAIAYYFSLAFSLILGISLMINYDDNSDDAGSLSFKFNFLQIFLGILAAIIFTFLWLGIVICFAECIIKVNILHYFFLFII